VVRPTQKNSSRSIGGEVWAKGRLSSLAASLTVPLGAPASFSVTGLPAEVEVFGPGRGRRAGISV